IMKQLESGLVSKKLSKNESTLLTQIQHIPYESSVKRLKDILQEETLSGFTQRDKVLSHVGALLEDFTFDKNN
ncbi:hypothetical protein P7D99_21100, partial [Enterococcus avium]|nr:hypothetical protein [Enterococcus avium]MDT2512100.1 hypothetical protein [Enterococcus avium]MDT2513963.1 hypothetical protein [Enterococcus avium]